MAYDQQNENQYKPLPTVEKSLNNISWHQKQTSAALADIANGIREIVSILKTLNSSTVRTGLENRSQRQNTDIPF